MSGAGYELWRQQGRYPTVLRREAHHEAAHAVVAEALRLRVTLLTIGAYEPPFHPLCRITVPAHQTHDVRSRLAIQTIAGNASESVARWAGRQWWRSGRGSEDRDAFRALVATLSAELDRPDTLWKMSRLRVRWRRRTIARVAAELLTRETLDGHEVRALIGWAPE
jgi:hypothetical protein